MTQASFDPRQTVPAVHSTFTDPAILIGTPVLTLDGELPVEFLAPGDRVVTRSGMRRITEIEVTRVQNVRVICVQCDSLGVGRPSAETVLSPNQQILVRDWRAKALYGKPEALIPASRLCDGEFLRADILPEARFVTLRFDRAEVIYAGGLELGCTAAAVTA